MEDWSVFMGMDFIWKAVLIVFVGTFLLRIAGRKTISQMTIAEAVLMVAMGTLLIEPVAGKNLWTTFLVGAVLVATLIVMEYLQIKSDFAEKFITGKSKILIDNGILEEKNLKKVRMTVDQLEMQLREKNITKFSDVKYATLEPNGKLGLTLKEDAQPATKKEVQQLSDDIQQLQLVLNNILPNYSQLAHLIDQVKGQATYKPQFENQDIFTEVKNKEHENTPPKHLQ